MMMDIFSSFDPFMIKLFSYFSIGFWSIFFFLFFFIHPNFWVSNLFFDMMYYFFIDIMYDQGNRTFGKHIKGFLSVISSLFLIIIFVNLMGMIPYMFSYTSHLLFTLCLGFPMWLMLIISGSMYSPSSFIAHLLPGGAPDWLNPFLVIIESVSISVRPITLSFRLAANMSAGHIVLGLLGIYFSSSLFISLFSMSMLLIIQVIYILFEFGICLIQAYIFCLLLTLYSDDHPHD